MGGGKKRLSRRISKLSGRVEGEGEGGNISKPGGRDMLDLDLQNKRGAEGEYLTFTNISKLQRTGLFSN